MKVNACVANTHRSQEERPRVYIRRDKFPLSARRARELAERGGGSIAPIRQSFTDHRKRLYGRAVVYSVMGIPCLTAGDDLVTQRCEG